MAWDLSAFMQDTFCSNFFCAEDDRALDRKEDDRRMDGEAYGLDRGEAPEVPRHNSNPRRARCRREIEKLAKMLQEKGGRGHHEAHRFVSSEFSRYSKIARHELDAEGLQAWVHLVPLHHQMTPEDLQRWMALAGGLGVDEDKKGLETVRWGVHAWVAARDRPVERADRSHQLRALGVMGADLEARDRDGNTPLLIATAEDAVGAWDAPLNQLLEFGADRCARNREGHTPLLVAGARGHRAAFHVLAASLDRDGKLGEAARATVTANNASILDLLVDRDDPDLLNEALSYGALRDLMDLKLSQTGDTPLVVAARKGRLGCVRALLDHGADVDSANGNGHAALHTAVEHGHAGVVEELLKRGATLDAPDKRGHTPYALARQASVHAAHECRALLDHAAASLRHAHRCAVHHRSKKTDHRHSTSPAKDTKHRSFLPGHRRSAPIASS